MVYKCMDFVVSLLSTDSAILSLDGGIPNKLYDADAIPVMLEPL